MAIEDILGTLEAQAAADLGHARMRERTAEAADESVLVARVFELAAERLAALRGEPAYPAVFAALAAEALAGVEGACELRVAPEDVPLAEQAVRAVREAAASGAAEGAAVRPAISIVPTLATSGGAVAARAAGRVLRLNTFESRLRKLRRIAVNDVAEVVRR